MEDWFYQMGNPLKMKNLLTYLLTYYTYLQVPIREVMYNFMITKPIEQTHNAMFDFYPCMRMYNLDVCQTQFFRTLTEASDPTREDWAFKVIWFFTLL